MDFATILPPRCHLNLFLIRSHHGFQHMPLYGMHTLLNNCIHLTCLQCTFPRSSHIRPTDEQFL
ncbi:hypothetical protein ACHAXM_008948, partial [Skeletonema potamos]